MRMRRNLAAGAILLVAGLGLWACSEGDQADRGRERQAATCAPDNGGLSLPPGFCATIFADNIGHARHLVVGEDGTVYANTWSGMYFRNAPPPPGGFLVAMKDGDGDGRADSIRRFGPTSESGAAGGTGIALFEGAIYAEENDRIFRYPLEAGASPPNGPGELVLSGLPLEGSHPMHPFVIAADGALFVNSGSSGNVCETAPRPGAKSDNPCREKARRAGIWRYDARKTGQAFSPAERYASGIRNAGGMAFDANGRLYATQHGRDLLAQIWPQYYTSEQGQELPAEELIEVRQGADYGWPECYFDHIQDKLVLAPEYGGDGKREGLCAGRERPVAAFPGHWAPNDVLIYRGTLFPEGYRGGAFIAFHGSWNRAPGPQAGYNITFQPLRDGRKSGEHSVFADGFAGAEKGPGTAAHRPSGLAMGPDGSLYVAEDVKGRIWRITYVGDGSDAVAPARPAKAAAVPTKDGVPQLPVPPGATAEQVALGRRIFHGEIAGGTCAGCHGADGRGATIGPALNNGRWQWSDGSLAGIRRITAEGVAKPKNYSGPMPPKGGAALTDAQLDAVAAYVWAIGQPR
jgi:glucose/arabinose dehydrogenase/mono/diheme cytochrome c family protein